MEVKNGYYIFISEGNNTGVGECSYIEGLSIDNLKEYEKVLELLCNEISNEQGFDMNMLNSFPSIFFGWETAMRDLTNGGRKILFDSDFTKGKSSIPLNGLVWMGDKDFMQQQIHV
jgi:O-succinylbenzoate synthase